MKEIHLSYEDGNTFKVDVIRYFRFKNNKYLIYTLHEKDDKDYIKLYVVKVMKELGSFVSQIVRSTEEWNLMKELVKRILIELKRGQLTVIEDLDCIELDKMIIYENKNFTMASDLVEILANNNKMNITEFEEQKPTPIKNSGGNNKENLNESIEPKILNDVEQQTESDRAEDIEILDL